MKVGLLVGRETTFPENFINHVNSSDYGYTAEMVKIGDIKDCDPSKYNVIIDRISHEIPFYRAFLKVAALNGALVINNPFWWSADDKFFGGVLASKLGVAVPRTVLLPQKAYKEDVWTESLRNLNYPLDWNAVLGYTGLPAIMKPFDGGGWRNVHKVNSVEELIHYYDQTGTECMMLQEFIEFDRYVRCYTVGRKNVRIMPYDPSKPYRQEQYFHADNFLSDELYKRIEGDCIKLNEALGYDINTAEFAIRNGIPYAIDFTNPAPDADFHSVGELNHQWFLKAVAEMIAEYIAKGHAPYRKMNWSEFINPQVAVVGGAVKVG